MNIDDAIHVHAQWKFKLRQALYSGSALDPQVISSDNRCELGKWLHGEGQTIYGRSPVFARCRSEHAEFHRQAGKIAAVINEHKAEEVEKMLSADSPFGQVSKKIAVSLVELKHDLPA